MISFYDWVIQFRNKKSEFRGLGKFVYNDPNFPRVIETSDALSDYMDTNYYILESEIDDWRNLFNLYLTELKMK